MAEMVIIVSPDGELTVRSEGMTRGQWEQATAELRAVLGEPTRQAIEAEQHVHQLRCTAASYPTRDTRVRARQIEIDAPTEPGIDARGVVLGFVSEETTEPSPN